MSTRVAPSDVRNIFDTNRTDPQLQACVNVANELVNNTCARGQNAPATGSGMVQSTGNIVLTDTELFNIELFLSCHFADFSDPVALQEKIGDSMQRSFPESVTTAWGQGLSMTVFGQQAVMMDRTGQLSALGLKRAKFRSARREDSDAYTAGLTKSTSSFKTL